MWTCERCGAGLAAESDHCAYCGTVSGAARAALQVEAAQRAEEQVRLGAAQAVLRQTLLSTTEQAASRTLMWGLMSVAFFCLPIPNVLALLSFKRAQGSAREAGLTLPTRAMVGLGCALATFILCIGAWLWLITDVRADYARVAARKAALAQQIATHAARGGEARLDRELACTLAEQYVLTNGFGGDTATSSFRDLDCAGSVRQVGDWAELPDFKLRSSATADLQSVTFCFKQGVRWFVESARATGCDLPPS